MIQDFKTSINADAESLLAAVKRGDWHGVKRACDAIKGLAEELILEELYQDDDNTPYWQK